MRTRLFSSMIGLLMLVVVSSASADRPAITAKTVAWSPGASAFPFKAKKRLVWKDGITRPEVVPPANDRCEGAILLSCGNINLSGNTSTAINDYSLDSTLSCTDYSANGKDVVYKLNVGPGDSLWIDYNNVNCDPSVYLVRDCANPTGTCVAGADDFQFPNQVERIRYKFTIGGVYYLILDSYGFDTSGGWTAVGQLVCGAQTPPANDLCEAAIPLPCGWIDLSGNTQYAHNDVTFPNNASSCTGHVADGFDVVYKMTISAGDSVWLNYISQANGSFYLVEDCANPTGSCILGADLYLETGLEVFRHTFSFSGTYYLVLDNRNAGTSGSWTLVGEHICANPPPPNDLCEGAVSIHCGDFSMSGTTALCGNDYALPNDGSSCTGFPSDGMDMVYRLDVSPGDSINVNYNNHDADGSIYIVTACDSVSRRCVRGADDQITDVYENLHYTFQTRATYYLILDATDPGTYGAWDMYGSLVCNNVGVGPNPTEAVLELRSVQPNPFSRRTTLVYELPRRARTTLRVVDLQGRTVRTLVDRDLEPGGGHAVGRHGRPGPPRRRGHLLRPAEPRRAELDPPHGVRELICDPARRNLVRPLSRVAARVSGRYGLRP
jgi:hypothetical protein